MSNRVFINGINGRMGKTILSVADDTIEIVGGASSKELFDSKLNHLKKSEQSLKQLIEAAGIIIDFTNDLGNKELFSFIEKFNITTKKLILGSTGLTSNDLKAWRQISKDNNLSVLIAPNTSLGVLLTMQISKQLAKILNPRGFDIEITEAHHKFKKDSPSGTATFLAEEICKEVDLKPVFDRRNERSESDLGVFAIRGGSVFGEHSIHFMGQEEYIKVSHQALSRDLFGKGAIVLSKWISQKDSGFYELADVSLDELI